MSGKLKSPMSVYEQDKDATFVLKQRMHSTRGLIGILYADVSGGL